MRVIVHGGAGSLPPDLGAATDTLDAAATAGSNCTDPLAAAVTAVRELESEPGFNAGVGSAVQSDGVIRTDAGLMTNDRDIGAACAMPGVEHAVSVARHVLADTPHVMLAGDRAVAFAADRGLETDADLWTDRTRKRWADLAPPGEDPGEQLAWVRERFDGDSTDTPGRDHDTVGAVATDGDRLVAATSTGGRWCALAGRVGDVPQVGAGFFASHAGGASATGAGEDIARVTLARRAVDHLEVGRDPADAAALAVEEFADITGSTAGVITMDRDGAVGSAENSEAMPTAVAGSLE